MKILSITVPCYNSQAYMKKCVDSLLPGGDDVEIIIVDDGSSDETPRIADEYAKLYPGIVKVIHQENGGHGEAVNAGIRNATGLYFKVVDSDDWVDKDAYQTVLETIKAQLGGKDTVDMFISNFIYDKVGVRYKRVMRYRAEFPQNEVFYWDMSKKLRKGHYILMHSVIYRTALLKECGLELPKHTFYVDNLFVFQPLPYVKRLYYIDVNFYHYFIGREDQSVHEDIMISRIDQQIKVNKMMIDFMAGRRIPDKKLKKYMINYLDIIMTVSSMLLLRSGTEENFEKKQELWQYLKKKDFGLYCTIRSSVLGRTCNLPGKGGRTFSIAAYRISQKFIGFN